MNLQNGHITLGALLQNPQAKAILMKNFPKAMANPLLSMAKNMTLNQLVAKAGGKISPQEIEKTLSELAEI
ncbi:MAG: hypothetical protein R3Y63_01740 [Eubacteriales bacterium]